VICQVLCLDYLTCLEFHFEVLLNMLEFYFEVLLNMSRLPYMLLMHVAVFSILGHSWLASIRSSRRSRPEPATGGSLLLQAAPLLLPRAARRCEALATATPLLLLHPMT
jgi:hypothetical protein